MSPKGSKIAQPKGPRFIWMAPPSKQVKDEFEEMAKHEQDFRIHFLSLNKRGNSLPLFNVYASDTWTYEPERDATLIGQMVPPYNMKSALLIDKE